MLFTAGSKTEPKNSTRTLLQNLLVLSVGSNLARSDEDSAPGYSSRGFVSLSATLEQAQVLTQAEQRGRLTLVLRNTDDITVVQDVPQTSDEDFLASKNDTAEKATKPGSTGGVIEHVR